LGHAGDWPQRSARSAKRGGAEIKIMSKIKIKKEIAEERDLRKRWIGRKECKDYSAKVTKIII
jgi:hypothetical protein